MKKDEYKGKQLIRNSTAEFLIFTGQSGEQSIEARYEDETIWLTQKLMAELFGVSVPTVNEHLKNIFDSDELELGSVVRKFRITAADGKSYSTKHYNLDAVISVGYRINSVRATQFRQWATQVLREILQDAGKVTATLAKTHAESEFEKYRIVQDRLFESDFDRVFKQLQQKDGEIKDR